MAASRNFQSIALMVGWISAWQPSASLAMKWLRLSHDPHHGSHRTARLRSRGQIARSFSGRCAGDELGRHADAAPANLHGARLVPAGAQAAGAEEKEVAGEGAQMIGAICMLGGVVFGVLLSSFAEQRRG